MIKQLILDALITLVVCLLAMAFVLAYIWVRYMSVWN